MKPIPDPQPPKWPTRLLRLVCAPHRVEELEGDLHELFQRRVEQLGAREARWRYLRDAVSLLRPSMIKREKERNGTYSSYFFLSPVMLRNYLTIAARNLVKNRVYSFINIFGLAAGMAVAMLIGLWVYDELSYDKQAKNYDRIGKLWQFVSFGPEKASYDVMPIPLAEELRRKYPDFEAVSLSVTREPVLASGDRKLIRSGSYVEPAFLDMLSVPILAGAGFNAGQVNSILLSESVAAALFGSGKAVNRLVRLENKQDVRVVGVYKDFPRNSTFRDVSFLAPWRLLVSTDEGVKRAVDAWDENSYQIYAQLRPGADFSRVSAKIKDIRVKREDPPPYKPEFLVHPMRKWHLYGDFKNGVNTGGLITFVRLFGVIGIIVLLLACINFMNLSTARSEKRAKEVGIRKAIGSVRSQLVVQFLSESFLLALLAFALSLVFVWLALPFFNQVADKKVTILWSNPWFWFGGLGFSLVTGLIAGSYPALYLSSFQPVKVLKGAFRLNRFAAVPRKVLVAFQFTVSVTLIIGTIIVFRQIEHAKNRPVGYNRNRLIEIKINTPELRRHYETLRNDLLSTGAVEEMSESWGSVTVQYGGTTDISWRGKTPEMHPLVMANQITHDYGKTVGWQVVQGRDFARTFSTDSSSIILNEAAVKLMGFKKPIGELVRTSGKQYKVVGVIKDMIKEDPFKPVNPSFFVLNYQVVSVINLRLAPRASAREALAKVEQVIKTYSPAAPFEYKFIDEEYALKFGHEVRIGKLAGGFAGLAILISCLGLFGLATFMAEQRTREIGIRKVLGASVFNVWHLLSREFLLLTILAFCLAVPLAYYVLSSWLRNYEYRTELSWWIFAASGTGALAITLLTVSYQSLKAALMNPVKSLRSE